MILIHHSVIPSNRATPLVVVFSRRNDLLHVVVWHDTERKEGALGSAGTLASRELGSSAGRGLVFNDRTR